MARVKLFILMIGLTASGIITVKAQSKKERIEILTVETDSLKRTLSAKNDSIHKLEVKLAKFEGAAEAHNEVIKRLESKSDSLKEALAVKSTSVETQTAEITKLNTEIAGLKASEKEWTLQNEALLAELKTYKQNTEAPAPGKEVKVAETPKAVVKTAVDEAASKAEPVASKE